MTKINLSKLPDKAPDYDLRDLLEAGCHFGHQRDKWNPKMAEYVYRDKEGVNIFDLAKTAEQLSLAYNYFYQLGKKNKKVIMVGTKRQARKAVRETAQDAGMMYISSRWLGGFLTNWKQIKQSLDKLKTMKDNFEKDEYDNLTTYEQAQLKKEITRLERFFEGIMDLNSRPDVIFVVDPVKEDIAVKEANLMDVPVVAIADSDANPDLLKITIPANDDAIKSVSFLVKQIGEAYKAGSEGELVKKKQAGKKSGEKESVEKEEQKKEEQAGKEKKQTDKKEKAEPEKKDEKEPVDQNKKDKETDQNKKGKKKEKPAKDEKDIKDEE